MADQVIILCNTTSLNCSEFPDTILSPHIGSFAGSYRFDIEKEAMENLLEALKKKGVNV